MVSSPNVGCFLRLIIRQFKSIWRTFLKESISSTGREKSLLSCDTKQTFFSGKLIVSKFYKWREWVKERLLSCRLYKRVKVNKFLQFIIILLLLYKTFYVLTFIYNTHTHIFSVNKFDQCRKKTINTLTITAKAKFTWRKSWTTLALTAPSCEGT